LISIRHRPRFRQDVQMSDHPLPTPFVQNVTCAFAEGAVWLDDLPALLAACLEKWDLTLAGKPFDLSFHYVVPVLRSGKFPAVLKLGLPTPELTAEAQALRRFDGCGAVTLLEEDKSLGALLLERVDPGTTLAAEKDQVKASEIAAQTMLKLWQAAPVRGDFRSLDDWTGGLVTLRAHFSGNTGPLDANLVDIAEKVRAELLQGKPPSRLLHADLHHFNLLYGTGPGWVAIDPKGVIGDPSYECASFLLNPHPEVFLDRSIQRARITTLADHLNLEAQRIAGWAFFQAILGAWWTIEDGGRDWETSIAAARVLLPLLE
jgi:streptomycin 6-kinase